MSTKGPAVRRTRANEADAPNPFPLIALHFEDDHDDEDDLVADFDASSVERSAALGSMKASRQGI